ncbi:hypothetical protein C343_01467 [Cryptococcus neoformans C23]|uniref:Pentatricopeptide repeat protein n=1 Tax=Cryptococcus neoformans (strain H99 / ATCC 208821 / CBS 10515 / FGSC 9487) TaxID=235443 RepID=J9VHC5_CRYN9|nr:hypothetical protein CNAG_04073 [Cryptococcus neoformans var. grubii H99]AFR93573.1 hypothetical protein CNAG_04073 [Cryptococcus neoformans var. grubii H99]AUB23130.1 hypothetical protein CKF44_04073 [Cryptococcus neoformans var. grubii]OWZ47068.1 hypothetical protein C343_01467 [Cryptococcus neoformans var. grubii C23]|eukprot:XP_012047660.1 hypothetical protein CNAG_04073 [Cryptococcus neoformans var. grubii H99]
MLPSQATRIFPRTAIPCTSVAQVLTLVHNEYLQKRGTTTAVRRISDAPSRISSTVPQTLVAKSQPVHSCATCNPQRWPGAARGRSLTRLESRELPQMIQSLAHSQSIRSYSSNAAQHVDDAHSYNSLSTPVASKEAHTVGQQERQRYKHSQILSVHNQFINPVFPPSPEFCVPAELYQKLLHQEFKSAPDFISEFNMFVQEPLAFKRLGSISNLAWIFELFRQTANGNEWAWLASGLGQLLDLDTIGDSNQKAMPMVAAAVRAFAVVQLGGSSDEIEEILQKGRSLTSTLTTHSLGHAIASLAYVQVEEWDMARKEMVTGLTRIITRITTHNGQVDAYPKYDYCYLKLYEEAVLTADRNHDLVDFLRICPTSFRHQLIQSTKSMHRFYEDVAKIFFRALARVNNPIQWWSEEHSQHPTARTRWLGTLMFIGLSQDRSRLQDALDLHQVLSDRGITVPADAAIFLCEQLAVTRHENAKRTLQRMKTVHSPLSRTAQRRILSFAGRVGWMEEEAAAWHVLSTEWEASWRDRIELAKIYSQRGKVEETIGVLKERVGEHWANNPHALEILFMTHIAANEAEEAKSLLDRMTALRGPSMYAYNALLKLYAGQVNVNSAVSTFDLLVESGLVPDLYTYTTLITLFAKRRDPVNAENVYRAMIDAGIKPDPIAHAAMINAEVQAGNWGQAAKRWASLDPQMRMADPVLSTIIQALVWLPAPTESVIKLFRQIKKPTSNGWALVLMSACDSGDMDLARDLYEEMDSLSRQSHGPFPNVYHFSILLHGYIRTDDAASSKAVYNEMIKRGILPSSVTYGMIIQSFTDARGERALEQAHAFAMSVHTEVAKGQIADIGADRALINQNIFSPLVRAHGELQKWEEAQSYFDLADSDGQSGPRQRVQMWTQLMDVHRRAGDVDKVLEVWEKIYNYAVENVTFKPSWVTRGLGQDLPVRTNDSILCIPLSIALDSLSSAGRYKEVRKLWNAVDTAGFGFDAENYNHLTVALIRVGDVEGGFRVAEMVLMRRYARYRFRRREAMREKREPMEEMDKSREEDEEWDLVVDEFEGKKDEYAEEEEQGELEKELLGLQVQPVFGPPNRRHKYNLSSPFPPPKESSHLSSAERSAMEKAETTSQAETLLNRWRPSDALWKPSIITISVIDHALQQLEEMKTRRVWIPLSREEQAEAEAKIASEEDPSRPMYTYRTLCPCPTDESRHRREQSGSSSSFSSSEFDLDSESEFKSPSLENQYLNQPVQKGVYGIVLPIFGNIPVRHFRTHRILEMTPGSFALSLRRKYSRLTDLIMFHRKKRASAIMKETKGEVYRD